MRKLKVDLAELEYAFDDASWEMSYFLDLETGQVVVITDDTRRNLEDFYQEYSDELEARPDDIAALLQQYDAPDWQRDAMLEADQVEAGYGNRYISVPQAESHEGYRDMENFILTVQDKRLQDRLSRAISGRGAFRYFKDVLYDYPRERERWFEFKDERAQRRVLGWLESVGIEPIIEPKSEPPPPPPVRTRLIAEVLTFARATSQLPGVTRIALIGSLATDEPDPKDADLLVTVTDEADIATLATQARKLQGHAQSFNRGSDVFLADPEGNYLGRTCPWKRCGPGIRASCDALHCGWRPYLHDDLETIRISKSLISAPPIELWPQAAARVPIPDDVEQELLQHLR